MARKEENVWNRFSLVYDLIMKKDEAAYKEIIKQTTHLLKSEEHVLEIATGTGIIALGLCDHIRDIEATDFSPNMIAAAKKKAVQMGALAVRFSVQDACDLQFASNSFDTVIISNALHIMPAPEKALLTVGVFTAIYFVVFFACGMLGYIPIFMLLIPFVCPFVAGIPFMLYLTKVKSFGMVTITGLICGVLMLITGMSWPPIFTGVGFGLIADLILKSGNYQSSRKTVIAYTIFSVWLMGMMLPLYFMRDSYFAAMVPTYGQEYVDALMSYTPTWSFFALTALSALGGFCGALLGKSVLKKHFKKAGLV